MDLQTWLATVIGSAGVLTPIVALGVWLVKGTPLSSRYYPHAAIVVGMAVAVGVSWSSGLIALKEAPLIGIIAGGMASGLFMLGKSGEPITTMETKRTISTSGYHQVGDMDTTPTTTETTVTTTPADAVPH